MNLSEPVIAAMIGASATITAATVQLVTAWRRHSSDGDRRKNKGAARSLIMLLLIVLSSAVAGYAYSQYRSEEAREDTQALRLDMRQQLHLLETTTAKLEQIRLNAVTGVDGQYSVERRRGAEGVAALVQIPPCKASQQPNNSQRPGCTEVDALRVAVCAVIPAKAQVSGVDLFVRPDDSQQPWSEARVSAGQEAGSAKFIDAPLERVIEDGKQVCNSFASWSSDKGRTGRVVVRYTLP